MLSMNPLMWSNDKQLGSLSEKAINVEVVVIGRRVGYFRLSNQMVSNCLE